MMRPPSWWTKTFGSSWSSKMTEWLAPSVSPISCGCLWSKRERTTLSHQSNHFPAIVSDGNWGGRATRAEVNLDAVAENIRNVARHAAPADVMAVVKANAYGHGAVAVGRTALVHGARWLGVYTVAEGASLRQGGVTSPILVFGPFTRAEADDIWNHRL